MEENVNACVVPDLPGKLPGTAQPLGPVILRAASTSIATPCAAGLPVERAAARPTVRARLPWLPFALVLAVLLALFAAPGFALADGCPTCTTFYGCVDDFQPNSVCTANDVTVASMHVVGYKDNDSCQFPGDTAEVYLQSELVAGANERYDVSMFVALDGGSAQLPSRAPNGLSCYHDYLTPIMDDEHPYTPAGGFGPFWNAENTSPAPADSCGDIQQNVPTFYNLNALTLPCNDANNDGQVDPVSTCLGWDNQSNQTPVCTSVSDAYPNTKSKCRCEAITVPELDIRKIIVDKVTIPGGYEQMFTFNISGPTPAGPFQLADGTTPYYHTSLAPGTYSVSETVPPNWTLSTDLDETYCTDYTLAKYSPDNIDLSAPIAGNREVYCRFTNRPAQGTLVVDKVTEPAGAEQSFSFTATGGPTGPDDYTIDEAFSLTDTAAPWSKTLQPTTAGGTYSVVEVMPDGWYERVAATCTHGTPDAVIVLPGQTTTCTFTNTRVETITVIKIAKDLYGNAYCPGRLFGFSLSTLPDFTLRSNACADHPTATYQVPPGSYTIKETDDDINDPDGWLLISAVCTGSGVSGDWSWTSSSVEVAGDIGPGEDVTCTFTNQLGSPLDVGLASFTAEAGEEQVTLAWETVSEQQTAGFNLYRGLSVGGPWTQLNGSLIPAVSPGAAGGASYTWIDEMPGAGAIWYSLEDRSLSGAPTRHDPLQVILGEPNATGLRELTATQSGLPWVAGYGIVLGLALLAVLLGKTSKTG